MFIKSLVVFFFLHKVIVASNYDSAIDEILKTNTRELGNNIDMLHEGDMMLLPNAPLDRLRKSFWPNGEVAYLMTNDFDYNEKQTIRNAVALITQAAPCIRFVEYTSNPPVAHVEVFRGSGCWSLVGYTGRRQQLSLAQGCMRSGIIVHEFLHALSFYHEQSRPDRDDYVIINYANILAGTEHNFRKATGVNSLGITYDRISVMHYSRNAFSNGGGPTIVWRANPSLKLGGTELSPKDKQQLNLLYCQNPPPTTPSTTTTRRTTTTQRTTTTTTKRPTENCNNKRDIAENCDRLVSYCNHPHYGASVRENCPLSCCNR